MSEKFVKIPVRTFYLQMLRCPVLDLRTPPGTIIKKLENPDIEFYKQIYHEVGSYWGWTGRLLISEEELQKIIASTETEIYLLTINNVNAGFFELDFSTGLDVEIVYIGLIPKFIGKGYGKYLLYQAVLCAWKNNPARVWLHTCENDHNNALENYIALGFQVYDEKIDEEYYPIDFKKH